jgi:hypothetical protein
MATAPTAIPPSTWRHRGNVRCVAERTFRWTLVFGVRILLQLLGGPVWYLIPILIIGGLAVFLWLLLWSNQG